MCQKHFILPAVKDLAMLDTTKVCLRPSANSGGEKELRRLDCIIISLLVAVALSIRLYLYRFHDVIPVDGIGYVSSARKLLSGDISGLSFHGFYPALTWMIGITGPDMETAAQLVSVIMGSLLVVPLYLLGMKLFSRATAFSACIVTITWSSHVFFSCIVANQAAYTTLALAGIYLVWRMFESRRPSHGCWAGLVMGLAFITRPEAFLLFFVMPLAPLWAKRRELHVLRRPVVAYCAAFTCILTMNMLLVHHFTGTWQLAAKTSSALTDTLSYYLNIPDLNQIPGIQSMGYLKFITNYPKLVLTNPINNLKEIFETILPVFLWLLALVGLFAGGLQKEKLVKYSFLLCSFAPLAVIVIFYYINAGYVEPFLPVLFLWCAEGARSVEQFIARSLPVSVHQGIQRFSQHTPAVLAASIIYAYILLVPQIPVKQDLSTYTWQDDDARRDHKRLGIMLKQYLPPGKIMSRSSRLAYYAEHEMVGIPNTDLLGIQKAAIDGGARFLVLDGRMYGCRPPLDFLFQPLHESPKVYLTVTPGTSVKMPGLHKYLIYNNPSSVGVIVYEIVN